MCQVTHPGAMHSNATFESGVGEGGGGRLMGGRGCVLLFFFWCLLLFVKSGIRLLIQRCFILVAYRLP